MLYFEETCPSLTKENIILCRISILNEEISYFLFEEFPLAQCDVIIIERNGTRLKLSVGNSVTLYLVFKFVSYKMKPTVWNNAVREQKNETHFLKLVTILILYRVYTDFLL